jgi:hypothetical protein
MMDCLRIADQLSWIRSASLDARARLDNGDSTGVERSLSVIEQALAAIRREISGGKK